MQSGDLSLDPTPPGQCPAWPDFGGLREQQKLPAHAFLDTNPDTQKSAILCNMGLGTGKTLTAIYAAHALTATGAVEEVYVLTKRALVEPYQEELTRCFGGVPTVYGESAFQLDGKPVAPKRGAPMRWGHSPTIVTHAFLNDARCAELCRHINPDCDASPTQARRPGRKVLLIVDEAHNARTPTTKLYKNLRQLSKCVQSAGGKVLLLTATPIVNSPMDLFALLNIMGAHYAANKNYFPVKNGKFQKLEPVNRYSRKSNPCTADDVYAFLDKHAQMGIVTHHLNPRSSDFPRRIDVHGTYGEDFDPFPANGCPIDREPYVEVPFSELQHHVILAVDAKIAEIFKTQNEEDALSKSRAFLTLSRQLGNCLPPRNIANHRRHLYVWGSGGEEGQRTNLTKSAHEGYTMFTKDDGTTAYQLDALEPLGFEDDLFESAVHTMPNMDNRLLGNCPKLMAIVDILYRAKREDQQLPAAIFSTYKASGVDITYRIIQYLNTKKPEDERLRISLRRSDGRVVPAIINGDTTKQNKACILQAYNVDRTIDVIFLNKAAGEGLNLKRTRQFHMIDVGWNGATASQAIGRAIRRNSHADLPESERSVYVYRWKGVHPTTYSAEEIPESADERLAYIVREKMQASLPYEIALHPRHVPINAHPLYPEMRRMRLVDSGEFTQTNVKHSGKYYDGIELDKSRFEATFGNGSISALTAILESSEPQAPILTGRFTFGGNDGNKLYFNDSSFTRSLIQAPFWDVRITGAGDTMRRMGMSESPPFEPIPPAQLLTNRFQRLVSAACDQVPEQTKRITKRMKQTRRTANTRRTSKRNILRSFQSYTGRRVSKEFPGYGIFQGTVEEVWFDDTKKEVVFGVLYDDGDKEDYVLDELRKILLEEEKQQKATRHSEDESSSQAESSEDESSSGSESSEAESSEDEQQAEQGSEDEQQPTSQAEQGSEDESSGKHQKVVGLTDSFEDDSLRRNVVPLHVLQTLEDEQQSQSPGGESSEDEQQQTSSESDSSESESSDSDIVDDDEDDNERLSPMPVKRVSAAAAEVIETSSIQELRQSLLDEEEKLRDDIKILKEHIRRLKNIDRRKQSKKETLKKWIADNKCETLYKAVLAEAARKKKIQNILKGRKTCEICGNQVVGEAVNWKNRSHYGVYHVACAEKWKQDWARTRITENAPDLSRSRVGYFKVGMLPFALDTDQADGKPYGTRMYEYGNKLQQELGLKPGTVWDAMKGRLVRTFIPVSFTEFTKIVKMFVQMVDSTKVMSKGDVDSQWRLTQTLISNHMTKNL